jgi:hypothetical protein
MKLISLFRCNVIEWHQNGGVNSSCIVQNGSCYLLDCETLLCSERWHFIPLGILSLGAVDWRDVPGRGVLWLLGGAVLKLAQDV